MCHGPLASHCTKCTGHRHVLGTACVCDLGYFDSPTSGPCSLYSQDCLVGTVVSADNTVQCSECRHGVNGPVNGRCEYKDYMYFETYSNPSDEDDFNAKVFYLSYMCSSLVSSNGINSCGGCKANTYPSLGATSTTCFDCTLKGCASCDSASSCSSGCGNGLFFSQSTSSCNLCFVACKQCTGGLFTQCVSCQDGFYWRQNNFDGLGECLPCDGSCKSCYGHGNGQCSEAKDGYYIAVDGPNVGKTQLCDSSCYTCVERATKCTSCFNIKTMSLDTFIYHPDTFTCENTDTSALFPMCSEVVPRGDGNYDCRQCQSTNYYKQFTGQCQDSTSFGYCDYTTTSEDGRDILCASCPADPTIALNKETGQCDKFTGIDTTGCLSPVSLSKKYFCKECDKSQGYATDMTTGLCTRNCPAGTFKLNYLGNDLCVNMPVGCLSGQFLADGSFFCDVCDTPMFAKRDPADPSCMNMVCNTGYLTMNKQCSPVQTPTTCDSLLCFKTDSADECTSGVCRRKMWEVVFDGLELSLRVNQRYSFFLSFDIKDYAVYETVPTTNEKRVFCKLISDDLNDELSTCIFYNGVLKINTVDLKYRQLLAKGNLVIKPNVFAVFRKYLSMDLIDITDPIFAFYYDTTAPIDFTTKRSSNWIVVYQKYLTYSKGIKASIGTITNKITISSYTWECTSAGGDIVLKDDLNSKLGALANKDISIALTNTAYLAKQITINAKIVDEFGQNYLLPFTFSIIDANLAIEQPVQSLVQYIDADSGIYVPFITSIQNIDLNGFTVSAEGQATMTTFTYTFEKRSNFLLMYLKVLNGNNFDLTITYLDFPPTTLWLAKLRPNYPSTIIHEKTADNITPFAFQLLNRKSSFKVYCVDEINQKQCIVNPSIRTYQPSDNVSLNDIFSYTDEGPKTLFFRFGSTGTDDTITSTTIQGLLSAQTKTPDVTTRSAVGYPEGPWSLPTDKFFIDLKYNHGSAVSGQSASYIDNALTTQSATVDYQLDTNNMQISQQTNVGAFRMVSEVDFTVNNVLQHKLVESRFISSADSLSVAVSAKAAGSYVNLDVASTFRSAGGTCNDASGQLQFTTIFDGKFHITDRTSFIRKTIIPGIFSSQSAKIKTKTHGNCGSVESAEVSFLDNTGLTFSSSLSTYINYLLLNFGTLARDQLNNLNMAAYQVAQLFKLCNSTTPNCLAPMADIKAQASALLAKIPDTIDENKYSMTSRYSLLSSFLWDLGILSDADLLKVLGIIETTSQFISDKILPTLQANSRFSRILSSDISALNLVQTSMVDFPITLCSNMLNQILFSYQTDTTRNDSMNRAIKQVVKLYQTKMLRISSHKRIESYTDANIEVDGMTVLSPLDETYTFRLNDTCVLVFKDLKFDNPEAYYEIILVKWTPDLLSRMDKVYNQSTNDFKKGFYYEFQTYFKETVPASGEAQILSTNCVTTETTGCTPPVNPPPGYNLCTCEPVILNAGQAPTAEKAAETTTPPSTCPTNCDDKLEEIKDLLEKGNLEGLDLSKMSNFQIWCFSTLIIEGTLTVIYITMMFLKNKFDLNSKKFCDGVSTSVLIHKILMMQESTPPVKDNNVNIDDSHSSDKDHSSPSTDCTLNPGQTKLLNELKKLASDSSSGVCMDKIAPSDLKKLTFWPLYLTYLKLNHMCLSLIFLSSQQYSKGTMITLTYLRIVAHLAVSMFFTLGVGPEDYSSNQRWMLRIIIVPIPLMIVFTGIRKLLSGDIGLSNIVSPASRTPHKKSSSSFSALKSGISTPTTREFNRSSSSSDDEKDDKKEKDPKTDHDDNGWHLGQNKSGEKEKADNGLHLGQNKDEEKKIKDKKEKSNPSSPRGEPAQAVKDGILKPSSNPVTGAVKSILTKALKYKIWIGRTALTTVTMGSLYSIMAISTTSKSKGSWPWGFWYAFSLGFDLLVFQPLMTLCQFLLVFKYVTKSPSAGFKLFVRLIIGKDIMTVFDGKTGLLNK
jgi:hypothetical protein